MERRDLLFPGWFPVVTFWSDRNIPLFAKAIIQAGTGNLPGNYFGRYSGILDGYFVKVLLWIICYQNLEHFKLCFPLGCPGEMCLRDYISILKQTNFFCLTKVGNIRAGYL